MSIITKRFEVFFRVAAALLLTTDAAIANAVERRIEALVLSIEADSADLQTKITAENFIPSFYTIRGFEPAWFEETTASILFEELERGVEQGFQASDFRMGELRSLYDRARSSNAAEDIALYDVVASDAAARLLNYSIFGKVDPASLDRDWNFERLVLQQNPSEVVNEFLAGDAFKALMDRVILQEEQYDGLLKALAAYRAVAEGGGWPSVSDSEVLKPGIIAAGVEDLRLRLAAEHALNAGQILPAAPETGESAAWVYDPNLEQDVRDFQARHGLEADGVIGAKTFQALNRTVAERVDQIRLSLERARWIMRDLEDTFVLVNIAGNRTYFSNGQDLWITRSITGTQYRKTPVFRDNIQYMEFNPTWTVPNSIFRKDKLSRIRKDVDYLDRNNYVVKTQDGTVIPASSVNWAADNPGVTLMQKPGPNNALGLVKFMFPNKYAVYLHDTDNRALFERNERNLSSGCVRIEYPFEFANLLMEGAPDWSDSKMNAILESGKTTRVDLPKPVPVMLTYWTAWVENGAVHFREDIYQRDARILEALDR